MPRRAFDDARLVPAAAMAITVRSYAMHRKTSIP